MPQVCDLSADAVPCTNLYQLHTDAMTARQLADCYYCGGEQKVHAADEDGGYRHVAGASGHQIASRLHPVIASQLGNFATEEDMADVAQSTWESAWRSRRNYDPDKGPLQSWVVSIARYRAIDRFNQKLDDVQKQKTYKIHASA